MLVVASGSTSLLVVAAGGSGVFPAERLGVFRVSGGGGEDTAGNDVALHLRKPQLDLVQPRRVAVGVKCKATLGAADRGKPPPSGLWAERSQGTTFSHSGRQPNTVDFLVFKAAARECRCALALTRALGGLQVEPDACPAFEVGIVGSHIALQPMRFSASRQRDAPNPC